MRIEQLEFFPAITQYGSLRRAAEHLHVSQSALSESITKLERELGVTLLDRHRAGVRISLAGRELLQPIMEVLESVNRLRSTAGDQLTVRRVLRVGTVNAGTASLVLPAVRSLQQRHPGSTVEIRNQQQDEIQVGLSEGTLDLGLVNLLAGDDVPPDLEAVPLVDGHTVAVLPATHRLARQASVTVDDLRGERFVAMRAGYLMHRYAHRLFGSDLPPDWHSTDGAEMGKLMVAEGIGLTVLPDYSVLGDPLERAGLIVARPLAGDPVGVTMVALYRRQARVPAIVRDLLTLLLERAARRRPAATACRRGRPPIVRCLAPAAPSARLRP